MKKFTSTKVFDGFSTVFRQWKAETTHCRFLHGYGVSFKLWFTGELDERNWVQDFGGLKDIKAWLKKTFDHTLCVAEDDPELEKFKELEKNDIVDLRILPAVGCEKFAEHIFNHVSTIVNTDRHWLESVEVKEHGSNGAIFKRGN